MSSVKKVFEETIQTDHKVITEELSKSILKTYGVKVPPFALVTSAEEAVKQAKKIGFPLVMKVVSPQILHKTDVLKLDWIMSMMSKRHSKTCMADYLKRKELK
jgi:3-hydroxypropionyl-CoA synthetase (ADP-forming)